jgi:hypothetical protein
MEQDAIKVGDFSQRGQGFHGAIQGVAAATKPDRQDNTMTIVKSVRVNRRARRVTRDNLGS